MKWIVGFVALAGCTADVAPRLPSRGAGTGATDDAGSGGALSTITPTGYLEQIATIYCEQAFGCRATYPYDDQTFESAWMASIPECTANLLELWDPAGIETEIAKGRAMFDGTAAVDCLGGVTFSACAEHWQSGIEWAEACYHVIIGTVGVDGTCDNDYGCESFACDPSTHRCL